MRTHSGFFPICRSAIIFCMSGGGDGRTDATSNVTLPAGPCPNVAVVTITSPASTAPAYRFRISVPLSVTFLKRRTQQLLRRGHIRRQRLATRRGHPIQRLRLASREPLLHRHVARLFQLQHLRAQVAVGRAGLLAQPGEVRLLDADQQRQHGQAQLAVDHRIEFWKFRHGAAPGSAAASPPAAAPASSRTRRTAPCSTPSPPRRSSSRNPWARSTSPPLLPTTVQPPHLAPPSAESSRWLREPCPGT